MGHQFFLLFVSLICPIVWNKPVDNIPCGEGLQICENDHFCNNDLTYPRCVNCRDYASTCDGDDVRPQCFQFCQKRHIGEITLKLEQRLAKKLENETEKINREFEQRLKQQNLKFNETLQNITSRSQGHTGDQIVWPWHLITSILSVLLLALATFVVIQNVSRWKEKFLECYGFRQETKKVDKREPDVHNNLLGNDAQQLQNYGRINEDNEDEGRLQHPVTTDNENPDAENADGTISVRTRDGTQDNEPPRSSSDPAILRDAMDAISKTVEERHVQ